MVLVSDNWFKAAHAGDIATIRMMIVEGVDVDMRDDMERTAFHIAAQQSNTDIMTAILAGRKMRRLQALGLDPFTPEKPVFLPESTQEDLAKGWFRVSSGTR